MHDTAKYLVHADITADGIVERSDVVGAVFGQTEGLLGDELDLRELQDASKVGRIDVEIDSQNGQSFGRITIATSLDQVETAILGAGLETIDRVGPCRSTIEVRSIEDVRAAKRREVVQRAKELLGEAFDGSMPTSRDLVEEVRQAVRVEDIAEYEGLPAGPRVEDSDAIVVVEGRADVLTLLQYGIKNAVAVEGTNVPDAVAGLTESRTVTAFFDGDRGGELILKELAQVGDVDYVAVAPEGRSVEDLARHEVVGALREKIPYDRIADDDLTGVLAGGSGTVGSEGSDATAETTPDGPETGPDTPDTVEPVDGAGDATADGGAGATAATGAEGGAQREPPTVDPEAATPDGTADDGDVDDAESDDGDVDDAESDDGDVDVQGEEGADDATDDDAEAAPQTLRGQVRAVVGEGTGTVRLLDESFRTVDETDAAEAFDLLEAAEAVPAGVVLDGELSQRLLDVAAQRGVDQIVAASTGDFVKQPTSVRIRTADELLAANEA